MAKPHRYSNPHKLTKEQDREIARLHVEEKKRVSELADMFGVYPSTIRLALKYEGVEPNPFRLHIKENAFDNLRREHAAYWLGFIYADGYASGENYFNFSVKLKSSDRDHLDKLRRFLEIQEPLFETITKTRDKSHNQVYIRSSNEKFVTNLIGLGIVVGRRNPIATLRALPGSTIHHFFRGVFDGDGCAHQIPGFTFLSQKEILEVLRRELITNVGVSEVRNVKQNGKIYRIDYGGFQQASKIKNYLYKDATVFMERKLDVINSWTRQTSTKLKWKYYHR